jgi:hypothetical protein
MANTKKTGGRPKGEDLIVTPEVVNAVKTVRMGEKMKKATEIVVENIRNGTKIVQKDILLEAGYSEATAISPGNVFNAKPFREILEMELPKKKLAEVHTDLIGYGKFSQLDFPMDLENDEIREILEDAGARVLRIHAVTKAFVGPVKVAYVTFKSPEVILKALDLAYKVTGSYAPTESKNTTIDLVALFNAAMASRRANNL